MPAKIIKSFGIKCTHQALRNQVEATAPLRPCSRCSGSGWEPNSLMEEGIDECPICKGEGCISEVREALKEVSISIACALEDDMENLQMSDLEHIQDKITELENLIDTKEQQHG